MRLIDADALLEAMRKEDVLKVYECIQLVNNAPTIQRDGWVKESIRKPPQDKDSLLLTTYGLMFVGRARYGNLGEPSQDTFAYRCSSSGRFVDVISHWQPLPAAPTETE